MDISGPFVRFMAQALSVGVAVFSRAFMVAYQQAVANAKAGGGAAAAAAKEATKKRLMSRSEALAILNLEENATVQQAEKQFKKYFDANDPGKGGSYYLQSKIYRANEIFAQYEKDKEEIKKKEGSE